MANYLPWILIAAGIVMLIITAVCWRASYVKSD